MYCGSGPYTDIPQSISNDVVLPVTLFLPLFPFPPAALSVFPLSRVQCLTGLSSSLQRSVAWFMGWGVWAAPATCGLLTTSIWLSKYAEPPESSQKKHHFHSVLHLICFYSRCHGHERCWPGFFQHDATCASPFSCFCHASLAHHALQLFFMMFPEQAALLTSPCPFLKSWDLPEGFNL